MYEYKVIEAPVPSATGWFGRKKSTYAQTLNDALNELALDNWEFQRAENGLTRSASDVLVFRRRIAKADEAMDAPKSFAERMSSIEDQQEAGRHYDGPVRPRRARIIGDAGPITERPQTLPARAAESTIIEGTARRVTPMKPNMAAAG